MKNVIYYGVVLLIGFMGVHVINAQTETIQVDAFEKVIVSPHIELTLVEGEEEALTIEKSRVSMDKINVEVEGKTLRIYLDGARVITKSEKITNDNWRGSRSIYNGTQVTATLTYKTLKRLSVRGEEVIRVASSMNQEELKLTIYGESKVYFSDLTTKHLTVAIYGESYLELTDGSVGRQVYRAYGESEVNASAIRNESTKITAYGESNFRVNVSNKLKVTCYGETTINYAGDAEVDKGIVIGEAEIRKIG